MVNNNNPSKNIHNVPCGNHHSKGLKINNQNYSNPVSAKVITG